MPLISILVAHRTPYTIVTFSYYVHWVVFDSNPDDMHMVLLHNFKTFFSFLSVVVVNAHTENILNGKIDFLLLASIQSICQLDWNSFRINLSILSDFISVHIACIITQRTWMIKKSVQKSI